MIIDLSGGTNASSYSVAYLDGVPSGGWTDEYKTEKLVLRRIPAGSFMMGSPSDELGRSGNETQHQVTLTKDFWIGVFEVTQRQWELVMGGKPSFFKNASYYATRPVECVSYNNIRGSSLGAEWPGSDAVDASSFMGKLRSKMPALKFDLPTEAQWEYACRAGTTTALNSGKNLTDMELLCANLVEVGRYYYSGGEGFSKDCTTSNGTAKVGSYAPNAWGLYDMHGNVYEWCLDWRESYDFTETDPVGASSGSARVLRGGCWGSYSRECRSAYRDGDDPSVDRHIQHGLRVASVFVPPECRVVFANTEKGLRVRYYDMQDSDFASYGDHSDSDYQWKAQVETYPLAISYLGDRTPSLVTNTSGLGSQLDFGATDSDMSNYHGKYADQSTENFVMKLDGCYFAPSTGTYDFRVMTDDGCVVYIDRQLVYSIWGWSHDKWESFSVTLEEGFHEVLIVYFECNSVQKLRFEGFSQDRLFSANVENTEVQAVFGEALPNVVPPTREGYAFGGYYSRLNGEGMQYYSAAGMGNRICDRAGELTLYPCWTPNRYTIAYNANGGSGSMQSHQVAYGEMAELSTNLFTKENRVFVGWATSSDGWVEYLDGQLVQSLIAENDAIVTLYAVWASVGEIEFRSAADTAWSVTSYDPFFAQSGYIRNNRSSTLTASVVGPCIVRFQYKVSSESGCDYLKVYLDAVEQAKVKPEVAKEALDPKKGGAFNVAGGEVVLTTAPTKPGLVYTLREGATPGGMVNGDSTIGDGNPWTPSIRVKGGKSGFYSISVSPDALLQVWNYEME